MGRGVSDAPIGVFDSGIGGLSVLQSMLRAMPGEDFVYLADNTHAPYGEKGDAFVQARSLAIARHLLDQHRIKALVVACNTATAAAIHSLRQQHPGLPLIGLEPAIKPAVQVTRTGRVGVMATQGTVQSAKFQALLRAQTTPVDVVVRACKGLALAIEHTTQSDAAWAEVEALLAQYTQSMGPFGTAPGHIDTLVLGCTHYVFAKSRLRDMLGPDVQLICTGDAVAKHTERLLQACGQMRAVAGLQDSRDDQSRTQLLTTGDVQGLSHAARQWLRMANPRCSQVVV
jgi:glutamate racemase